MRQEKDFIGEKSIPSNALYGIHSARAKENFPDESRFHLEWYKAVGIVKLAAYLTIQDFYSAARNKFGQVKMIQVMPSNHLMALIKAAEEVASGKYYDHFIVPGISGGAGTSINMNVNEIITNVALKGIGKNIGDYHIIDPIEQANLYQSTNDVIPTALRVAIMQKLDILENSINDLRNSLERLENVHRDTIRIGYTQMQAAVPSSYGRLFSTYNEALSRDWWRVSKGFERIKVVNLGGSAIGSGITIPRYYIMTAVRNLQKLTGMQLTRSENMQDTTSNLDSFVEVHAILKAHAVNLEKMMADIRLLSSDINKEKELELTGKQAGSSIMPGKVNPVIPEFVISSVNKIYANDQLICSLSAQGCLELNAYLPVIGNAFMESLKLLIACNTSMKENVFSELQVNSKVAKENLLYSPSLTTVLLPFTGYNKASELAAEMKEKKIDIFSANNNIKTIEQEKLIELLKPENLLKEGFSLKDTI